MRSASLSQDDTHSTTVCSPTILLVEDDAGDAQLIAKLLAEAGGANFGIQQVSGMAEARERLAADAFDLVLLKLSLPDGRGLDAFRELHEVAPRVPVIVLAAPEEESVALRAVQCGAQNYLVKGQLSGALLARSIRCAIERTRRLEALRASEKDYRELFDNASDAVYSTDLKGNLTWLNRAAERISGYGREEALAMNIAEMLAPHSRKLVRRIRRQLAAGAPKYWELALRSKRGGELFLEASIGLKLEGGKPVGYFGLARDITARKHAERLEKDRREVVELVARNQGLETVLTSLAQLVEHQLPEIICSVWLLRDGRLFHAASRNLPREYVEVVEPEPTGPIAAASGAAAYWGKRVISANIATDPLWERLRDLALRHDLHACWAMPIFSGAGQVLGTLSLFCREARGPSQAEEEIIETAVQLASIALEQRQLSDQLTYQAQHDPLTRLPNRLLLADRLEQAIARARRSGEMVSVLYIDLDRFKLINDTLGHALGDQVLQQVVRRVQSSMRQNDTLARVGGDEFMLVLTDLRDRRDATLVAIKVLEALQESFEIEGHELFVTASIGISVYPQDGRDAASLQRNADAAMYRAKKRNRNGFQCFTPEMNAAACDRVELEASLRRAVANHGLHLNYQPQFELRNGRLAGFEALLRWDHPKLGSIPPAQFVPLLEELGLILPISSWVLSTACSQNRMWQERIGRGVRMAVNVSALWFARPEFYEDIATTLEQTGLEPRCLDLELTESMVMRDIEATVREMAKLRELGVGISLDDFGTGYSSLSYLQRLPLSALKVDQSFIRELTQNSSTRSVAQAIIGLAHGLGLDVVAEGVETGHQLEALRHMGCDRAQGYLLGEPLPASAAEELLLAAASHPLHTRRYHGFAPADPPPPELKGRPSPARPQARKS